MQIENISFIRKSPDSASEDEIVFTTSVEIIKNEKDEEKEQ